MSTVNLIPATSSEQTEIEIFSISSQILFERSELRLDANHFNPTVLKVIEKLYESRMQVVQLGSIVSRVFIPPRFKRTYVESDTGIPLLQGSHIVQFEASDVKYLSKTIHKNIEQWIIRAGWLLVTCSGTIGRITICPKEWDGWAGSQHILRIVPKEEQCPSGWLYAFLASPFGQAQLAANAYGAVVDEITAEQMARILVPLPETKEDVNLMKSINDDMERAIIRRSDATSLLKSGSGQNKYIVQEFTHQSKHFIVPSNLLVSTNDLRIDASHYDPQLSHANEIMKSFKMPTISLGEIAKIFMPPRFKRVYVEPEHGLPFLQGSHILHFWPDGFKYISQENFTKNIDEFLIKTGWLLMTRSGTVGRVAICPEEWDGWTATEDIIRIIVNEDACPSGYLYSFLKSPLGQVQLLSQVHGAVVDHLTENHVKNVLIPLPSNLEDIKMIRNIDLIIKKAISIKSEAVIAMTDAVNNITQKFEIDTSSFRTFEEPLRASAQSAHLEHQIIVPDTSSK